MKDNRVQIITRTAMLLALALVFQNLRLIIGVGPHTQFIVGSLVNAVLIVAAGMVSVYSGIIIAFITPIVAFFQGHIPNVLPMMILVVGVGNALIVLIYSVLKNKNEILAVIAGAIVKFIFLFYAVRKVLEIAQGSIPEKAYTKISSLLSVGFSWPQLVTALIGGFLAIIVLKYVKKAVD